MEEIGPQSHHAGAPAPLLHVVQAAEDEAGVHLGGEGVELPDDVLRGHAGLRQLRRPQHHVAVAGGEVPGVHHVDIGKLLGGQHRVLVAGGELRADVDVDHRVVGAAEGGETVGVVGDVQRGGGADVPAGVHMGVDVVGGDVQAVPQGPLAHVDAHGEDADVVALDLLRRQVAGAVRCDFDRHVVYPILSRPVFARDASVIPFPRR